MQFVSRPWSCSNPFRENTDRISTVDSEYVPPSVGSDGFNCPACGAFAHQSWYRSGIANEPNPSLGKDRAPRKETYGISSLPDLGTYRGITNLLVSECNRCGELTIWLHDGLVWPIGGNAPPVNPDLPEEVQLDYREAGVVAQYSPRSAAALLRLAVEKLCQSLVPGRKTLNARIRTLVERGLNPEIQQALDIVRVVGNNAVHPGKMDISDDQQAVATLFRLVNLIGDEMITRKSQIAEFFDSLPESDKSAIAKRDGTEPI